jgi:hypothetical protein
MPSLRICGCRLWGLHQSFCCTIGGRRGGGTALRVICASGTATSREGMRKESVAWNSIAVLGLPSASEQGKRVFCASGTATTREGLRHIRLLLCASGTAYSREGSSMLTG